MNATRGTWVVYICHPYASDPMGNEAAVREICRAIARGGMLPIGPHIYLPQFMDETTQREEALSMCVRLLDLCDEVQIYGDEVTAGMSREIDHAKQLGIPVRWMNTEAA